VEVALYNLFSVLWETETGQPYRMTKANDVYSGLGAEASILSSKLDSLGGSSNNSTNELTEEAGELLPVVEGVDETDAADEVLLERQSFSEVETLAAAVAAVTAEEEPVDFDFSEQQPQEKSATHAPESEKPLPPTIDASSQREKEIAAAVLRAETIEESYSGVKVRAFSVVAV
jgi:hypothetical protein